MTSSLSLGLVILGNQFPYSSPTTFHMAKFHIHLQVTVPPRGSHGIMDQWSIRDWCSHNALNVSMYTNIIWSLIQEQKDYQNLFQCYIHGGITSSIILISFSWAYWLWPITCSSSWMTLSLTLLLLVLIGSVYRIETMHRLLCFNSKFPNHFAFTLGRYLFLQCSGLVYLMWILTIVIYF